MAAQTLGTRTTRAEEVKKLMESKFVDVLRAVAAEMTMTEMHEQRADFVQKVQQSVANDLEKNGLELESVSLTGFDQTDLQFFNENNAFDAEGRARLAKIIEEKRKETNDIQQENRIQIEQRNLEAEKLSLNIKRDEEEAKILQEQALAFKRQEQKAEISKQREQKEQEERQAEIAKDKAIAASQIEKDRDIEAREIEKRRAIEEARIQQLQQLEVAEQNKQIAIANKSEEESAARAKAAEAEKLKVEKEEAVTTARQVAEANRRMEIEVIDAENTLKEEQIDLQRSLALLKVLPEIIASAVKPLENIDGIKILQGYNAGAGGVGSTHNEGGSLSDQVTRAALNYRANAPLVDSLLREIGLVDKENGTLEDLLHGNAIIDGNLTPANATDDASATEETTETPKAS